MTLMTSPHSLYPTLMALRQQSLEPVALETLMEAYQKGDRQAGNELFSRVSQPLYRYLSLQSGDRRHADDLLQEVWLRVHRARPSYRPGEKVLPWLYAIARYVKVDAYRRRRTEHFEDPLDAVVENKAMDTGGNARDLPQMEELLAGLPQSQREVIVMLKVSGLSLEEVAKATASTVGSVKQKAHRAYKKLRATLTEFAPKGVSRELQGY
jgi:RNA polymerase sigma-70 factor (ECF subfamily)